MRRLFYALLSGQNPLQKPLEKHGDLRRVNMHAAMPDRRPNEPGSSRCRCRYRSWRCGGGLVSRGDLSRRTTIIAFNPDRRMHRIWRQRHRQIARLSSPDGQKLRLTPLRGRLRNTIAALLQLGSATGGRLAPPGARRADRDDLIKSPGKPRYRADSRRAFWRLFFGLFAKPRLDNRMIFL